MVQGLSDRAPELHAEGPLGFSSWQQPLQVELGNTRLGLRP